MKLMKTCCCHEKFTLYNTDKQKNETPWRKQLKLQKPKFKPSPTTSTFDTVLLHTTWKTYSPRYVCQLDSNICNRSNNPCCTHFRKDLDF